MYSPRRHRDTEKNLFTNCEADNCDSRPPHRVLPMLRRQIEVADHVFSAMACRAKDLQLTRRALADGNVSPRSAKPTKGQRYQSVVATSHSSERSSVSPQSIF